jgi:UDP-GlcNAc:undecaprenyl-phosphate GlcNAc-1-phosphate transferase
MFTWFLISSFLASYIILPYLVSFLIHTGCTQKNFRGKLVPVGSGILLTISWLVVLGLTSVLFRISRTITSRMALAFMVLVLGVSFFGILDDLLGDRSVSGFYGHFSQLKNGELTTGVLKALGGGALSLFVALPFSSNWFWVVLNGLMIALCINTFNLLDLRPGRAIKMFGILILIMLFCARGSAFWYFLGLFIGPALLLLRADLEEMAMLGDVGSNILGAVIGFGFMVTLNNAIKIIVIASLIFIQLFAEKYSLSDFIAKVPVLHQFDELGRKR